MATKEEIFDEAIRARNISILEKAIEQRANIKVFDQAEKDVPSSVRSYVKSKEKPEINFSEIIRQELSKIKPTIIQKTIKKEIIQPIETIKETRIKEDVDLRREIEILKKELEMFKQILPLGGSGVVGLPGMQGHSGQFLTTDGNNPSWSAVSNGGSSSNPFYFGDPNTDGTWRLFNDGTNFLHQRRESGVWIEKGADLA